MPSLYWVDTTAATTLPGRATYLMTAALIETQWREQQLAERRGPLEWTARGGSPVRDWFRYRKCLAAWVRLPPPLRRGATSVAPSQGGRDEDAGLARESAGLIDGGSQLAGTGGSSSSIAEARSSTVKVVVDTPRLASGAGGDEPRCRGLAPGTRTAMRALAVDNATGRFACAGLCTGDAHERVLRPYRGPKDADRAKQGMQHVLKPEGCRFHWFDEGELTRCLAGRSVLNIGGSVANGLQRGFERISSNMDNKKQWWWSYGRTGVTNNHDEATGKSVFNRSVVTTQFIHHPFRYGLSNVLRPDPKKVVAYKSAAKYESLMCAHDVVVFESGVHDLASPDRHVHRSMLAACAGARGPCTDAQLLPLLHNESWRLDLLGSYRAHLEELMQMWDRCREQRRRAAGSARKPARPFRPVFKLSTAPNPGTEMSSCTAEWGYNTEGWYLLVANAAAREIVEAHGYEVFDPYPATQHAARGWYDLGGKDSLHVDSLSDLITQMLINQLCD